MNETPENASGSLCPVDGWPVVGCLNLFSSFVYVRMAQSLAAAVDRTLRLAVSQVVAEVDIEHGELVSIDELLKISPTPLSSNKDFPFAC